MIDTTTHVDMGDPIGAARHIRKMIAEDGTWMIVEPAAGDRVEDNFNPIGRAYYGFPPCCARRRRSRSPSEWRWARRRGLHGSATS
jgi:hypothetical protein